jgi:translation initiation factor 1
MPRLFAGTPFDIPPTCERCGKLEEDCDCPPPPVQWLAPEKQSATVRVEKRKANRMVTIVSGLNPKDSNLPALLKQLKDHCGAGGSLHDDLIEIQGDQLTRVRDHLAWMGYQVR